ncbi:hypothetical protein QR680_007506 [Steinernema hermaphroditum]|uniref:non-specific protein-tyrosine kinase n=1 Tax=Steinernema hermaphroditum TaxID=289476 RepID=A0AA39M5H1_9BILA|nr:hypothetical protein QR680_007506 [Steinernema hermaphroditum]
MKVDAKPKPRQSNKTSQLSAKTIASSSAAMSESKKKLANDKQDASKLTLNTCQGSIMPSMQTNTAKGIAKKGDESQKKEPPEDVASKEMARALTSNPWYHGLMPREEIEELLKTDGDFLVRKTEVSGKARYAVSVYFKNRIRHILLNYTDGIWCLREIKKSKLTDLIEEHVHTKTPVQSDGTTLVKAVPRPEFYILHEHVEVKKKLGGGAFGDVHIGTLKRGENDIIDVAVKKLKGVMHKKQRTEFVKEAKLMRRFDHANIVRMIGVAPQEEPLMILLELASGGSLQSKLKSDSSIDKERLTRYVVDGCRGMCYLAGRKVIHRDIAARNCLLGKNEEVKISDFGLSVADKSVLKLDRLKNMPIKWLSPETLRKGEFSTKSDVWAFGVLIWEVFSRCKSDPFPGENNTQARAKILSNKQPMQAPEATPNVLSAVMALCFTQDPKERPDFEGIFKVLAPKETPPPPMTAFDTRIMANSDFDSEKANNLALFEAESFFSATLKAFTTPSASEDEEGAKKSADLGVMLGVYLPTIQHILGVTMFIRLAWCVGVAGVGQTFLMLFLCCFCTFLTSISVSAVATNGKVEGGGPYFLISRNLGPEFGTAIGILFYLANTVATSMYLVGGVEILLLYIAPELTIGGKAVHTGLMGMMSHNLRFYATVLLIVEFAIVAMGVKFVQLLAPVSLVCVVLSILSCYAGAIEKSLFPDAGQSICMLGDHLLQAKHILPEDFGIDDLCNFCVKNASTVIDLFCPNGFCSKLFLQNEMRCINGFPGFASDALIENLGTNYLKFGEFALGKQADKGVEVFQDVSTSFFLLLAIYFPAVTGIFTGTNMSGDLRDAQASIPGGTIAATLTTSFIYFSLAFVFGGAVAGPLLRDKYGMSLDGGMVVASLAWPSPWILLVGAFLSTFGAALQCLCSAPRLLHSIAKDDVLPVLAPFARLTKSNEPFVGLLLTTVIAELAILLGAMDQIAAVVDFFFLMCYAFVNAICVLHSVLGAPNWRPRFRLYHWTLSALGAFLCLFIMFSTHWDYAVVSCVLCAAIYKYVEWKGAKKEWGDGIRGVALSTAQYSLQKIEEKEPHPKNWRPQLLLLHSTPFAKESVDVRYTNLMALASQLKAGKGLSIVVSFLSGDAASLDDRKKAEEAKERMEFDMAQLKLRGFAKTVIHGEDQLSGSLATLIQSVGMGGLRPNTLLLSWPLKDEEFRPFSEKLHACVAMDMSLLVAKGIVDFPGATVKLSGAVDVYWIVQDGGLCLLAAYLLKQHRVWRHCSLRVIAIAQADDNNVRMKEELEAYVYALRIDAAILVVELADAQIAKTAFERTLLMEEAKELLAKKHKGEEDMIEVDLCDDSTEGKMRALDRSKVKKMNTAVRLNEIVLQHSADSQLVIMNLPKPPHSDDGIKDYVHYLEVLSNGLQRTLFVRGTGQEVITTGS